MRTIEFLAPVEAMRGNLTGSQDLEYPQDNNSAWDTPEDGTQYAVNYKPRYVGAKRAANGKTYFSVKIRHGVNLTGNARIQQAAFGAAGSLWKAISLDASWLQSLAMAYSVEVATITTKYKTMRDFFYNFVVEALKNRQKVIRVGSASNARAVQFNNPWITGGGAHEFVNEISLDILRKFWYQLSGATAIYYINGKAGILPVGFEGDFGFLTSSSSDFKGITRFFNTFGVISDLIGEIEYVKLPNGAYLLNSSGQFVEIGEVIYNNSHFTSTFNTPA